MTVAEQRARALDRANEIRLARTALKRRIGSGDATVADVLLSPGAEALTWPVCDLLASQRRWGATRVRRLLARTATEHTAAIGERKPVGELTDRQRRLLVRLVA